MALLVKAVAHCELGDFKAAIATYEEVIERFGASEAPELRTWVAWALYGKGMRLTEIGRAEEALHICEELERRLDALADDGKTEFAWRSMWVRTKAWLIQEKHQAAMDAFRSAYAAFVPGDETMMREMIEIVPDLIVSGVSEHDLVEVLSSDKEKSDSLTPLVVALRQNIGEEVRASPEVLEVATDIRKLIEERSGLRKPLER